MSEEYTDTCETLTMLGYLLPQQAMRRCCLDSRDCLETKPCDDIQQFPIKRMSPEQTKPCDDTKVETKIPYQEDVARTCEGCRGKPSTA